MMEIVVLLAGLAVISQLQKRYGSVPGARLLRLGGASRSTLRSFARRKCAGLRMTVLTRGDMEACQARDYCASAAHRAARSDPSPGKTRGAQDDSVDGMN